MNNAGRIALTIASCAGAIGIGVAVHYNTKKAEKVLKEKGLEDAPIKEKLKAVAPSYIPSIIFTIGTIACIAANHKLSAKEIAAITAAGGVSARLLTKYKTKIKEMFGEDAYEEVVREVARDEEERAESATQPIIFSAGMMGTSLGATVENDALFYDEFSNEWFESSLYAVSCAILHLNRNFTLGGSVTYSMFREFIGLKHKREHDYEGWGQDFIDGGCIWIDFEIIESHKKDGTKYYILTPIFDPETLDENDRLNASYARSNDDEWNKIISEKWQDNGVV